MAALFTQRDEYGTLNATGGKAGAGANGGPAEKSWATKNGSYLTYSGRGGNGGKGGGAGAGIGTDGGAGGNGGAGGDGVSCNGTTDSNIYGNDGGSGSAGSAASSAGTVVVTGSATVNATGGAAGSGGSGGSRGGYSEVTAAFEGTAACTSGGGGGGGGGSVCIGECGPPMPAGLFSPSARRPTCSTSLLQTGQGSYDKRTSRGQICGNQVETSVCFC